MIAEPSSGRGGDSPAQVENSFQEKEQVTNGEKTNPLDNLDSAVSHAGDVASGAEVDGDEVSDEQIKPEAVVVSGSVGDVAMVAIQPGTEPVASGDCGADLEPVQPLKPAGETPLAISGDSPLATNGLMPVAISGDDSVSNVVAMFPGINGGLFGITRNAPTWRPPKRKTKPGNPKVAADGYEWRNAPTGDGFVLWRRPYLATGKRGKSEYYAWFAPATIKQLEKIYGAKRKSGSAARPRGLDSGRGADSSSRWPKAGQR